MRYTTLIIIAIIVVCTPAALMTVLHAKSPIRRMVRLARGHFRLYALGVCPHCGGDALFECPVCRGLSAREWRETVAGVERVNRRIAPNFRAVCWGRYRRLVKRGTL